MDTFDYIIGIDEVGRGCLAGPVTVAAVAIPIGFVIDPPSGGFAFGLELRDSKKLSPIQRNEWASYIRSSGVHHIIRNVHPEIIDELNITNAANLAAHRAIKRIMRKIGEDKKVKIYLDGGLYIKSKTYQLKRYGWAETLVRADENVAAVSLASIVAKVSRDRYMGKVARRYPQYGFHLHKGYGTEDHREAISKYGFTPIHRLTFLSKYNKLSPITNHQSLSEI